MKNIIFFALSILFSWQGLSQPTFASGKGTGASGGANMNFDFFLRTIDLNQKSLAFNLTEAQYAAIVDEAYANPVFVQGNIYQDENLVKKNAPMRYNAFADEIEIKNNISDDSEDYGALMKDPSIYVKMVKDLYVFIPYEGSNENGGYFNIITDGKTYDLYKKIKAVFHEPSTSATSYDRDTEAFFTKKATYYLMKNGTLYELPKGQSKILKVMDKKEKEVKNYVKENNLNLNDEKDLANLVSYFDSLL